MVSGELTLRGAVLSERPVGEYDKLVTILTLERGKVRAFARGAMRPRNHLAAVLQPFYYGIFRVYEGRDSYTVEEAEILQHFEGMRSDLDKALTGMLLLELADYYGRENADDRQLLSLLYVSLQALERGRPERALIQAVYEIRALAIDGQYPGVPEGAWDPSTCYAMDYIVRTPMERLYSFAVSGQVLSELRTIAASFRRRFIDRELKSLALL